jgi:hypothetical protein
MESRRATLGGWPFWGLRCGAMTVAVTVFEAVAGSDGTFQAPRFETAALPSRESFGGRPAGPLPRKTGSCGKPASVNEVDLAVSAEVS